MADVASHMICTHASRIVSTQPGQFDPDCSIIVSVPDYSAISTPAIFQDDAVFRSAGKGGTLENRLLARQVRTIVTRRCGRGNERISEGGPVAELRHGQVGESGGRRREADDCPDIGQEPDPDDGLIPGIRFNGRYALGWLVSILPVAPAKASEAWKTGSPSGPYATPGYETKYETSGCGDGNYDEHHQFRPVEAMENAHLRYMVVGSV